MGSLAGGRTEGRGQGAVSRRRAALGAVWAVALVAGCGASGPIPGVPDDGQLHRLTATALEAACGVARRLHDCEVATSAEDDVFSTCDCVGEARGRAGTMRVTGARLNGSRVDATHRLAWDGERWELADGD